MADEQNKSPEPVEVKLNFRIPGRMPTVYAHHMIIQPGDYEVTLSFFEVIPPLVTDGEDQLNLLREVGIVAECVARITVAKDRFAGFARAIQQIASQI